MIRTILLILLLSTTFSEGSLFISLDESTWYAQNRNCTPATPNVIAAETDYQVDENIGINISTNDHIWTGYYQVVRVFQYIGCVSMKNYEERPFVEIKGDPGHCFPACGDKTVIGVTRTRVKVFCYCLGSELNIQNKTEAGCIQSCNGPAVACGKDSTTMKYAYLSIYKMNTNVTANTIAGSSKETNCLTMDPTVPKTFIWDYCTVYLPPMCAYGGNVRMITSADIIKHFPWIGAANECFMNKSFPTTYSNSKYVGQQGGSKLWTGMFKTSVVYRYNADIPENRRHDTRKFGYLTRDSDNNVKLQFTDTDSNKRRLCIDGKLFNATVILTSKPSEHMNGKNDKRGTSPRSTKTSPFIQSFTMLSANLSSTTTANITDTSAKSSFGTVVILALCGSLALVSVVIVLLVCFLNRRKKNRPIKQCDKNNLVPSNRKDDTENSAKISFQGDCCHVVIDQKGNLNDNRNDTYDTAIEDIVSYNKKHIQVYSKSNEENFYDQLADETTYDHAITTNQINRSNSCENETDQIYDKSIVTTNINVDRRLTDNIYNQSGVDEEGEYNHFGPKDKNLKTDNVYGVVQGKARENMDNEYDVSISRHCKNTSNGHIDNTYSCLSDNSNN